MAMGTPEIGKLAGFVGQTKSVGQFIELGCSRAFPIGYHRPDRIEL